VLAVYLVYQMVLAGLPKCYLLYQLVSCQQHSLVAGETIVLLLSCHKQWQVSCQRRCLNLLLDMLCNQSMLHTPPPTST
jgi:hypothetical protein